MPISIFPLLLLVGVAWTFPWSNYGNEGAFRPIVSRSDEKRICVELCMSGLGGDPCGEDCVDLSPVSIPIQSKSAGHVALKQPSNKIGRPRNASCPVLCENSLGYPLCNCKNDVSDGYRVDFVQICGHFCLNYDYQIFGCQPCDVYRNLSNDTTVPGLLTSRNHMIVPTTNMVLTAKLDPFWEQWCVNKCSEGEGGSACNCDKPVMAIKMEK